MTIAAEVLVQCLKAHNIDRVFCVPGESYLSVINRLRDARDINVITCRHESGAGFMALGHARLTSRPGVVFVSRGPGCMNAAIAIHSAQQDASPLVVFVGQAERENLRREAFQAINYEIMFNDVAKWAVEVNDEERLEDVVSTAFYVAQSGTPGPVVVSLPEDMLEASCEFYECYPRSLSQSTISATDADAVLAALAQAKQPLIIAGGLMKTEAAKRTLQAFAEAFQLPVATSVRHADVFDNNHPLFAGHLTYGLPPALSKAVGKADLVMAIGCRLGDVTSQGFDFPAAPKPAQQLIHIWPDANVVSRYRQTDYAFPAHPVPVLEMLLERHKDYNGQANQAWCDELHRTVKELQHWEEQPDESDGIVFGNVAAIADALIPQDAIICMDAGNFGGWVQRQLRFGSQRALIGPSSGAMGYGTPSAIGCALEQPDRQVVCFVGDGGFLMTGNELATAAQNGVNLVVIICDNGSYGTIRMHQEMHYPGREYATTLRNPNLPLMAKALGATAYDVQKTIDFAPALKEALAGSGLQVIVVRTAINAISANATISELQQRVREG